MCDHVQCDHLRWVPHIHHLDEELQDSFTGVLNHSKSLSREPCGRGGECEERGIQSGQREGGKEVGRDGERNGKREGRRVGRDEEREKGEMTEGGKEG